MPLKCAVVTVFIKILPQTLLKGFGELRMKGFVFSASMEMARDRKRN